MIDRAVLVHYRTEETKAKPTAASMATVEGANTKTSCTAPVRGRGVIR